MLVVFWSKCSQGSKVPWLRAVPLEAVQLALHRESGPDSSPSVSDYTDWASFWKQGWVVFASFTVPDQNEWKDEEKDKFESKHS